MRDEELLEFERQAYLARRRQALRRQARCRRNQRRARTAAYVFMFAFCAAVIALILLPIVTANADAREEASLPPKRAETVSSHDTPFVAETALVSMGSFRITHYCACEKCCGKWSDGYTATMTRATEGRTIAVDPDVIPLGSEVAVFYDDGRICYYTAEDTGSVIKGNRIIDVYMDSHEAALEAGVLGASVYLVNEVE